jgi:hypothetical protein
METAADIVSKGWGMPEWIVVPGRAVVTSPVKGTRPGMFQDAA